VSDQLLFGVAPYGAALVFVTALAVRCVLRSRQTDRDVTAPWRVGAAGGAWRLALGVIALGHLAALVFPGFVLRWDLRLSRLVALEGVGFVAGSLAVAGAFVALVRLLRAASHDRLRLHADVVAATLLLVATTSGVGMALLYRWASAWSVVTLVPYLYSLARFEPSPNLVTHMPPLVKLHVLSAIALVTVFPFTATARVVLTPVDRLTGGALAPMSRLFRPAWVAVEAWTAARLQASVLFFRNREEEN